MENCRQWGKVSRDGDAETSPSLSYFCWEIMGSGGDSINIYIFTASPTFPLPIKKI